MPSPPRKILIIHPAPTPYRVSLFNRLLEKWNITVLFMNPIESHRKWSDCLDQARFPWIAAAGRNLRVLGKSVSLSRLPSGFDLYAFDAVLVSANPQDFLLVDSVVRRLKRRQRLVLGWVSTHADYGWFPGGAIHKVLDRTLSSMMARLVRRFDRAIAYCESGAAWARGLGVPCTFPSQYYPLEQEYGSVSLAQVTRLWEERAQSAPLKVLILSYLDVRKGLLEALDIAARLPRVEFHVVGSGPPAFESYLRSKATANVVFRGHLTGEAKRAALESAHLLWFPTRKDSWGFVVNEAMYFGLPVAGTRNAMASVDLVQSGNQGFLYDEPHEIEAWLGRMQSDPDRLREMGLAAKQRIGGFNDTVLEAFDELFAGVEVDRKQREACQ